MAERSSAPRRSDAVAADLRRMILDGEAAGETLEPTTGLMRRFGVSRPTLREALRTLEAERLVAVKRGSRSGVRILKPDGAGAARAMGLVLRAQGAAIADIYEARLAFEPYAAGLLATRRDGRDIAVLRRALAGLQRMAQAHAWGDLAAALARFHFILVDLTGNKMLSLTAETLAELLARHQRDTSQGDAETVTPDDVTFRQLGWKSIARLTQLIEAGDAAAAEAHWREHVTNANDYWLSRLDRHAVIEAQS